MKGSKEKVVLGSGKVYTMLYTGTLPETFTEILKKVIPYVDFFLPSIEELCIMIDRERYHEWLERANGTDCTSVLDLEKDIRPLADKLMNWGAKVLCIKCGAPGLYFRTANQERPEG